MAPRSYGALEDENNDEEEEGGGSGGGDNNDRDNAVLADDGWPACDRPSNLFGSRQGVLLGVSLQEMQRALALSAVVSTLPVALFAHRRLRHDHHGDVPSSHVTHTDPSLPWLVSCSYDGLGADDDEGCLYSPTRIVAVQMMAMMGALVGIPVAGYACDVLGFPYVVTFGSLLQPLVMEGYNLVGRAGRLSTRHVFAAQL